MLSYISSLIGHEPIHHSVFLSHRSVEILADRCDLDDMPMRSPSFRPSHNKRTGFFGSKPFTRTAIDSMGRACLLGSPSSKRALPINSTAHRVRMTGPVCSAKDLLKTLKERGRFPTRIIVICHPLRTARICRETKISNYVLCIW